MSNDANESAGPANPPSDAPPASGGSGGPAEPPPAAAPPPVRRLRRSRRSRVLAGVAGGLSEYTGVDPILYRVLFAVLAVFGGAGILLYLVLWLFLPEQDQDVSPAESLIGRGRSHAEGVLLAFAAIALAVVLLAHGGQELALLAVVVIGMVFLIRHLDERSARTAGPALADGSAGTTYPGYPAAEPYPPGSTAQTVPVGTTGPPTATATWPPSGSPPPAPKPPRERSVLGLITFSVLLVAVGVLVALDRADVVHPDVRQYLAVSVGVIGLGLLVGAWIGRARWLAVLGIPLSILLIGASTADIHLRGGVGKREYRPASIEQVQTEYRVGIGDITVDLSDVDFTERGRAVNVHTGIGAVHITVPPKVDVTVTSSAGAGEINLFGVRQDGSDVKFATTNNGADGPGGGHLDLNVDMGLGSVEVFRASS